MSPEEALSNKRGVARPRDFRRPKAAMRQCDLNGNGTENCISVLMTIWLIWIAMTLAVMAVLLIPVYRRSMFQHLPDEGLLARLIKVLWAAILLLAFSLPAFAVEPDEILKDATLEARARELSAGFRCLVCQNQSIDDSDAPLAKDLRLLIREHLVKGKTDAEIIDHVTGRYGEFVLLKPRFDTSTLLLWLAPFAVLLAGIAGLWRRRLVQAEPELPLTEAEKHQLNKALE